MSYEKPIKIFFNYLNINRAGMGENVNPHPRLICFVGQVKYVH